MKIARKVRGNAELDVTAFSDIAFLLIIFFILTTTFVKPFGQNLDIPSGTSDAAKKDQSQLTIVLRNGQILFGEKGEQLDVDILRERLKRQEFRKKAPDQRMVLVECAKDVPYEDYFEVVTAIAHAGGVLALLEDEEDKK